MERAIEKIHVLVIFLIWWAAGFLSVLPLMSKVSQQRDNPTPAFENSPPRIYSYLLNWMKVDGERRNNDAISNYTLLTVAGSAGAPMVGFNLAA